MKPRGSTTPSEELGWWPLDCLQRAFVAGAKWWQFHKHGSTAFAGERDEMEAEAVRRYGEPARQSAAPPAAFDEHAAARRAWRRLRAAGVSVTWPGRNKVVARGYRVLEVALLEAYAAGARVERYLEAKRG